jgi:hypothetical protein
LNVIIILFYRHRRQMTCRLRQTSDRLSQNLSGLLTTTLRHPTKICLMMMI